MSVTRWHAYIEDDDGNDVFVAHTPDLLGSWVRHGDHVAEVGQWAALVDRLTQERDDEHLARAQAEARVRELLAALREARAISSSIRAALATVNAGVPAGHTHMTDGITPSEPTEWLQDLAAVSTEKEGNSE